MIFIAHLLPHPRGVNQNAITRQVTILPFLNRGGEPELRLLEAPVRQDLIAGELEFGLGIRVERFASKTATTVGSSPHYS
jgi:hypothetical protein